MGTLGTRFTALLSGGSILLSSLVIPVVATSPAAAQTCVQAPSGLEGWWPGDGNADDIAGGHHGTLKNGATFAAGLVGQAFSLDGVNDHVSAPFSQVGPFTVDLWAKTSAPAQPAFTSLLSSASAGHYDPFFQIELDGLGNYRVDAGNGQLYVGIGPATTSYQHIAVTYDGSDVRTYLDRQPRGSGTWTGAPLRFEVLKIGINRDENRAFGGLIDEVEVFGRALSGAEIGAIHDAGAAGKCKVPPYLIDASGGDCSLIGIWDAATATCTLTASFSTAGLRRFHGPDTVVEIAGIEIVGDGVTLDGNGHVITGSGSGSGIFVNGSRVTVRDVTVQGFEMGIRTLRADHATLRGNVARQNSYAGFYFQHSGAKVVTGNELYDNGNGLLSVVSGGSVFSGNFIHDNGAGGLHLQFAADDVLRGNTIVRNGSQGIDANFATGLEISDNVISGNGREGILLWRGAHTVTGNTLSDNAVGLYLYLGSGSEVYRNDFVGNATQAVVDTPGNAFNLPAPIGGNYWSDYDTPAEGCSDASPIDGFCDSPYLITAGAVGGRDELPWAKQDGWRDTTPPVITPSATTASGATYTSGGWTNEAVTAAWTASDPESGIATSSGCGQTTIAAETAGTTLTCSATNGLGLSASASFTVRVDLTSPEVVNSFDPAALDLAVAGRDALSGVASVSLTSVAPAPKHGPTGEDEDDEVGEDEDEASAPPDPRPHAMRRTYVVTDLAGNATTIVEDVRRAGHELRAAKVAIRYGAGPEIAFPENGMRFQWALAKDGSLKELEQNIEVGGASEQDVEAKFGAGKGTTIRVKEPEPEKTIVSPELVLLRLVSVNGGLDIEH